MSGIFSPSLGRDGARFDLTQAGAEFDRRLHCL
jgi:hypothetical protein